jgi:hypothetical protein
MYSRSSCKEVLKHKEKIGLNYPWDFELNIIIEQLSLKMYWCEPAIVKDGSGYKYASVITTTKEKKKTIAEAVAREARDKELTQDQYRTSHQYDFL